MTAKQKTDLSRLNLFAAEIATAMLATAWNRLEAPHLTIRVDGEWFATVSVGVAS